MTGRPTFGDFANAARDLLRHDAGPRDTTARHPAQTARAGTVGEFTRSMTRLIAVMDRYCADITAVLATPARRDEARLPGSWPHASIQVREGLHNASAFLLSASPSTIPPDDPHDDPAIRRLDATAAVLAAGRDLLHTHVTAAPDGSALDRSEWATVITSEPVARALLLELGLWARRTAEHGVRIALPGPAARRGTGTEREQLNTACQWLWVLDSAVRAAQHRQPVSTADVRLLHAIPVNNMEPRRIPGGAETITSLCHGTTSTAERIRRAVTIHPEDAKWSPALTSDSFRHAATCSTVTSHNCEILLHTLATRAAQHGSDALADRLLRGADAAGQARLAWLHTARAWYDVTTDTRGTIAPDAAQTGDLALWTGRLAYADPAWTPALGPSHPARTPESLAPEPGDMPAVVAAVHQATETLTQIAAADHGQIEAAAQARRLLIPTRSLPDRFDIPHPFTPAPRDRVEALLGAYHGARTASAKATAAVATIAADVRAPSHILTLARGLTPTRGAIRRDSDFTASNRPEPAEPEPHDANACPGPVERILHDLGVTNPAMLIRASAIDQVGEQLVLNAAHASEPGQEGLNAFSLTRSTGSAELINHILASDNPDIVGLRSLSPATPPTHAESVDRAATNFRYIGHQAARQEPQPEAEP
jgi:hypothetical protein